jgi:type IV secretion system protein VirD4
LAGKLFYFVLFLGIVFGCLYAAFRIQKHQGFLPEDRETFAAFFPYMAKKQGIWLGIATACEIFGGFTFGFIVLCFAVAPMFYLRVKPTGPDPVFASKKELELQADEDSKKWLASLGSNASERANKIEAIFAQRSQTISASHFGEWSSWTQDRQLGAIEHKGYLKCTFSRSLANMNYREREWLRVAERLNSAVDGTNKEYRGWRAAILWGDGKGQFSQSQWLGVQANEATAAVAEGMAALGLTFDRSLDALSNHAHMVANDVNANPAVQTICKQAISIATGGGDTGFLTPADVPTSVFKPESEYAIRLGTFDDGTWLTFSNSGALVTIAGPGSGKSQGHVIPNLLQWKAPAVVLDVKGELYDKTAKWRAANVGPVYRFAPTDPANSHHYNPLAFVSEHPDEIWKDARLLTDMLIVPSGNKDNQFWDSKAKELVTAAVAYICVSSPPAQRNMSKLLDIIHGGAPLQEMIVGLKLSPAAQAVPAMGRAATALMEMNEKTKGDVLATVQTSFHGWEDAPVARITDRCDWSPLDLKSGSAGAHPTVYICLKSSEMSIYLSILRVFIAQHIRMLTSKAQTEADRSKVLPILFLLDELPQLKEMPPVTEAIDVGAGYGLRIWMFAQSLGQLREAYPNADGMIGACVVRTYMNPSGADGLAESLSKELGYKDSLTDGSRVPKVEPAELAGPKWENLQLVFGRNTLPARLNKNPAWKDSELAARMKL